MSLGKFSVIVAPFIAPVHFSLSSSDISIMHTFVVVPQFLDALFYFLQCFSICTSVCLYSLSVLVCYLLFFLFAIRDLRILIIVDLNLQSDNFNIFTISELHSDPCSVSTNCVLYLLIIFVESDVLSTWNPMWIQEQFLFPVFAPVGCDSLCLSL